MNVPLWGVLVAGLGWGTVHAADEVCAAQERVARAIAVVRDSGLTEAQARAALLTAATPPEVRGLVASTIALVYASRQPPEVIAAQAEAVCRQIMPGGDERAH